MSNEEAIKVVLLGEVAVGKSSLAQCFSQPNKNRGARKYEPTIGAAFVSRRIAVIDDEGEERRLRVDVWDTAGEERYHSLAPLYYRNCRAAIVAYDVTAESSFRRAKKWVLELRSKGEPDTVIMLVGNKIDLAEEEAARCVWREDAADYAASKGILFMETSATTGYNVERAFDELGRAAVNCPKRRNLSSRQDPSRFRLFRRSVSESDLGQLEDLHGPCCRS